MVLPRCFSATRHVYNKEEREPQRMHIHDAPKFRPGNLPHDAPVGRGLSTSSTYVFSKKDSTNFFLSLFVTRNDNDVVKGDFADKVTLKYSTPIIFALFLPQMPGSRRMQAR